MPAQHVPIREPSDPPLYVWSDAMFELVKDERSAAVSALDDESKEVFHAASAAIAFVVFDPVDGTWHSCSAQVGPDVLKLMVPGKRTYIGQLEALAAAAVLSSMPAVRLRGRRMLFWIDNLAAKYGLQKGYSKVDDSGRIINSFKVSQARLGVSIHFEYVPSHQNVADLPSRDRVAEMRQVIFDATGTALVGEGPGQNWFEYDFQLPEFRTWESPLGPWPAKRVARSGSRGAKRQKASQEASVQAGSTS